MNYMLFDDGTMNVMVNGRVQRRKYSVSRGVGAAEGFACMHTQVEPEHGERERVMRYINGDIEIVSIGEPS